MHPLLHENLRLIVHQAISDECEKIAAQADGSELITPGFVRASEGIERALGDKPIPVSDLLRAGGRTALTGGGIGAALGGAGGLALAAHAKRRYGPLHAAARGLTPRNAAATVGLLGGMIGAGQGFSYGVNRKSRESLADKGVHFKGGRFSDAVLSPFARKATFTPEAAELYLDQD